MATIGTMATNIGSVADTIMENRAVQYMVGTAKSAYEAVANWAPLGEHVRFDNVRYTRSEIIKEGGCPTGNSILSVFDPKEPSDYAPKSVIMKYK